MMTVHCFKQYIVSNCLPTPHGCLTSIAALSSAATRTRRRWTAAIRVSLQWFVPSGTTGYSRPVFNSFIHSFVRCVELHCWSICDCNSAVVLRRWFTVLIIVRFISNNHNYISQCSPPFGEQNLLMSLTIIHRQFSFCKTSSTSTTTALVLQFNIIIICTSGRQFRFHHNTFLVLCKFRVAAAQTGRVEYVGRMKYMLIESVVVVMCNCIVLRK